MIIEYVKCNECGEDLRVFSYEMDRAYLVTMNIEPCEKCLENALEDPTDKLNDAEERIEELKEDLGIANDRIADLERELAQHG